MNNSSENINIKLLRKIKSGDVKAFEAVYEQMRPRMTRFIRLSIGSDEDVEELVQEVFIKIWEEHQNINLEKSFEAFIYTIAKNKINDFLRKVLQQKKYIESFIANYSIEDSNLERIINYRETDNVIRYLIDLLPERRKQAFELSRFKGKSYREISSIMDISENTVDTHIRKSLAFLKEGLVRFSSIIFFL